MKGTTRHAPRDHRMTTCARGCCFTGLQVCARAYSCKCHWDARKPAVIGDASGTHRDPTARDAIRNVMQERNQK